MSSHSSADIADASNLASISQAFVNARRQAQALAQFPGALPQTMEQAYDVQRMSLAAWADMPGEAPAGWKIGGVPPHLTEALGTDRLVGPAFPSRIVNAGVGSVMEMPIFEGGFAAAEAEFMFRIGETIKPGAAPVRETLLKHIASLHIGVEIASSPIKTINEIGPLCVVSDFGNNNGMAIGAAIPDWQSVPLSELVVSTEIDGQRVGQATAQAVAGGPIAAMEFLVAHCARYDMTLTEGTIVSTGAVTGIHDIGIGQSAHADFGKWGHVTIKTVKAQPLSEGDI